MILPRFERGDHNRTNDLISTASETATEAE
jgi:hypothetical protein